jgi:hypothetical protein
MIVYLYGFKNLKPLYDEEGGFFVDLWNNLGGYCLRPV